MSSLTAVFHGAGRTARQQPDPAFPQGLHLAITPDARDVCAIDLAYPSDGIGTWEVRCTKCGVSVALTAAGRVDDPRRVVIGCGERPGSGGVERRAWKTTDR